MWQEQLWLVGVACTLHSHESLIPGMCRYARDNLMTGQVTLHLYTYKAKHTLHWQRVHLNLHHQAIHTFDTFAANQLPQTVRQPSHQAKNKNYLSRASCVPPPPSVEGADFLSQAPSTHNHRCCSKGAEAILKMSKNGFNYVWDKVQRSLFWKVTHM
jgi:hypothetical protein